MLLFSGLFVCSVLFVLLILLLLVVVVVWLVFVHSLCIGGDDEAHQTLYARTRSLYARTRLGIGRSAVLYKRQLDCLAVDTTRSGHQNIWPSHRLRHVQVWAASVQESCFPQLVLV